MNKEEILKITKKFHDTYEKLSKEYDYETRKETRVFDINSSNGKLMYATVNEVIKPILEENQELKENLDKYENPEDMTLFAMWCTEKVKDENEKLNKKYENALADYEKTMFEKEQLNSLVNSCQEEIRRLKKQLEDMTLCRDIASGHRKEVQDRETILLNQQKEFIKYLKDMLDNENDIFSVVRVKDVLNKYKETIGDINDKK